MPKMSSIQKALLAHYDVVPELARYREDRLPCMQQLKQILRALHEVMFPGFCSKLFATEDISGWLEDRLKDIQDGLVQEIRLMIPEEDAKAKVATFMQELPEIRRLLMLDAKAAFDGDPAATMLEETVVSYPGMQAVFTYRIAHALYCQDIPVIPRMLSELAHTRTGADIHPGAQIGESFFIDHATGVVIGETCIIGKGVKVYHGVTFGALSTRAGQGLRGVKRHPTIGDDVTVYPHATVLGGETIVGDRCVINGGVFLMHSVAPDHTIRISYPKPQLRGKKSTGEWSHWVI